MPVQWMILAVIALVVALFAISRMAGAWLKYRGRRVITCPANLRPAGVVVDARLAAVGALGRRRSDLRLSSCTRWPEQANCGQECLKQIQASPEDCLVRNIVAGWYEGKSCARCGQPFMGIDWTSAKPAVLRTGGASVEWNAIPAEELQQTLATAVPVCFACHTAERLVREHPELVVDRSNCGPYPGRASKV